MEHVAFISADRALSKPNGFKFLTMCLDAAEVGSYSLLLMIANGNNDGQGRLILVRGVVVGGIKLWQVRLLVLMKQVARELHSSPSRDISLTSLRSLRSRVGDPIPGRSPQSLVDLIFRGGLAPLVRPVL